MNLEINGKIKEIDKYGKLRIIIENESEKKNIINKINEQYTSPYIINEDYMECIIIINKYFKYYYNIINSNINNNITCCVKIKRYSFDKKYGTHLFLLSINNIK